VNNVQTFVFDLYYKVAKIL